MNAGDPATDGAGEHCVSRVDRRFVWISSGVFAVLTGLLFWRYAIGLRTTVSDPGDPIFLMFIMDWVQRAVVHFPQQLFDAPIFHPFRDTLAYSDPLLTESFLTLPLRLLGAGPIAMYNAVYLGGIAVAGVVTAVLFARLTGDRTAALAGGIVATFPALRLYHLAHMQLQVTTFLPLALWLVHAVVEVPSVRRAAALSGTLVAATLSSLYYGAFLSLLLPPFALSVWLCRPRRSWAGLFALFASAGGAGLLLVPFARVYRRAISGLSLPRSARSFSDLTHYLGVSPFADVGRWLPSRVVRDASPEWIGGGGALLLPVAMLAVLVVTGARIARVRRAAIPPWALALTPYAVLGCSAILCSLGPEFRWAGHDVVKNPFGFVTLLPGMDKVRDFQRAGVFVAIAGGGVVAMGLAELSRRNAGRWPVLASAGVVLSTITPAFSSTLPAYRPPSKDSLPAVYAWLERQPEPLVLFEVPLPSRGIEPLEYLWSAIYHRKRMVHGFSGYLPLFDSVLRSEATGAYRPDFFRSLSLLGATHLVVHTDALARLPDGAASLTALREAYGSARVARFADAEVYVVEAPPRQDVHPVSGASARPAFATGGWLDRPPDCLEVGPGTPPLVYYVQDGRDVVGLTFRAESPIGEMDDSVLVERSSDLKIWRSAPHAPLLSTSIASYLGQPTAVFWTHAALAPENAPFLRLTTRRTRRVRVCDVSIEVSKMGGGVPVPQTALRVETHAHGELAPSMLDGKSDTRWQSGAAQNGGEWIELDLGRERKVLAVTLDLGRSVYDYGRRLAVECSASDGNTKGPEVDGRDALFERPRPSQVLPVGRSCRRLRIRQTGNARDNYWSVFEIAVIERRAGG